MTDPVVESHGELAPVSGGWRAFLWIAALYNFAVGLAGMFVPGADTDGMVLSLLVACFGLVYAIVASDPMRYAQILWAGVASKLGVVLLLGSSGFGTASDAATGFVVAGDLIFALGFIAFLFTAGRRND